MTGAAVTPELWIGPCPQDEDEFKDLRAQGLSAILSLQTSEDLGERGIEWAKSAARSANLAFRNVPVNDFDLLDLTYQLPKCVKALDELLTNGHKVYLHCTAGVSRSPTVAAAYLHWRLNWTVDEALANVREVRNCVPLKDAILRAQWRAQN